MEAGDFDWDRVLRIEIIPEIQTVDNDNDVTMAEPVVELINVRSQVLKAKSGYFRTLFTIGMAETSQSEVTIKMTAAEKPSFMQLMHHMTGWPLIGLRTGELFNLLSLTQRYDAKECMRVCCVELKNLMREEDAVHSLQLDPYLQMEKEVQSLTEYAIKFKKKLLGFPLNIVMAIISSDDLEVRSEDVVCNFVYKWAKAHCSKTHARRDVLRQLARNIRFHYMTFESLKKVSSSRDFDTDVVQQLVLDALFFKTDVPQDSSANQQLTERVYKYRPVKVLKFKVPQPACVVYLELPHVVCGNMFPSGHVYSEKFELGHHEIYLFAACENQGEGTSSFGLFLEMTANDEISVDFEFAARAKPLGMFEVVHSSSCTLGKRRKLGSRNLLHMLWDSFIKEDGKFFCGGALHLRADIKLKQKTVKN